MCISPIRSQSTDYNFLEETNLYTKVSDINLMTTKGVIKLSEIYDKTPVMLTLVFTRCVGICSPFLNNLTEKINELKTDENFRVLVISFDPEDGVEDMVKMANRYERLDDDQWIFAVSDQIDELNTSIGFFPVWDSSRQQFDHDALLVGINENGFITKKLLGIRDQQAILSVIKEINNAFIISYPLPRENMLFSCFTYDPSTGKKKASFGLLILMLPAIITLFMLFWFSQRKQELS